MAWCSDPALIPQEMELEIVEPVAGTDGGQSGKCTLVYPVTISVPSAEPALGTADPPSPPPDDDERRWQRRQRRQDSPDGSPAQASAPRGRVPMHARLGPHPTVGGHVDSLERIAASSAPQPCDASAPAEGIHAAAAASTPEGVSEIAHKMARVSLTSAPVDEDFTRDANEGAMAQAAHPDDEEIREVVPQTPNFNGLACTVSGAGHLEARVVSSPPDLGLGPIEACAWSPTLEAMPLGSAFSPCGLDTIAPTAQERSDPHIPTQAQQLPLSVNPTPPPPRATVGVPPPPPQLQSPDRSTRSPRAMKVYSRRRFKRSLILENQTPMEDQQPPSQLLTPAAVFIAKLSKTAGGLLPAPHISKRRKKPRPTPSEAPRRSRRLAGLGVLSPEVCPPHLKKKVMRALDMDVADDSHGRVLLDQKVLDEYARRFRHSPASHVAALAAIFGLTPPEDLGVESDMLVA